MKKIILLNILIFTILTGNTQTNVIYEEHFNNSNNVWTKNEKNIGYSKVKNGNLLLKSDEQDALRFFSIQEFIDNKKDFSIETKMKQTAGNIQHGYGLMWGARGLNSSFYFMIASSGYYCVGNFYRSYLTDTKKWTESSVIKGIGEYNKLKVSKEGKNIVFYINDKAVYTNQFSHFYGQNHGFVLQNEINCSIDYLKITNNKTELEIADIQFKGEKKNIGTKINTTATDIAPIISADGNTLYFARGNYKQNYNGTADEADIWYSTRQADGSWSKAKNIGYPLNNSGVNVVVNAMPDGNTLFLEGLYNKDGSFKSDQGISVTHKTLNGWSVPKKVNVDNFYNKNRYETYFFTTDQKVLLLSIERDDTYGDKDLYVSFRKSDGSYTEPKNMGAVINTFGDEGTPFMAPDNKTLYFSTSGLKGFGSNDIYMSKRLDDTWLNWSKPLNLGKSINTSDWDTYLSVSARGDTAFLVSTYASYGFEDIFIIAMEQEVMPEAVVVVKGKVLDEKTKTPIGAEIIYSDLSNGKEVGIANSDPKTGKYQIVLPYGKQYALKAKSDNYIAQNENIDLRNNGGYNEVTKNLYLMKIKVGETIILNNIFFDKGSAKLQKTSHAELDRIVKILKNNPKMVIELSGHTDNRGNPDLLLKLSEDRINNVKAYIVNKGISASRIKTKAYGSQRPINKNESELEHSKNRRVEFKILSL